MHMQTRTAATAILCCLSLTATATLQSNGKVPVYVTSAGARSGFTDPSKDNRDTVKDIRNALDDRKNVVLVDDEASAAIVLVVLGRQTEGVTAGFLGEASRDRVIRVKFTAAESETELTASAQGGTLGSGGAWRRAAGKIAQQVDDWARDNAQQLAR